MNNSMLNLTDAAAVSGFDRGPLLTMCRRYRDREFPPLGEKLEARKVEGRWCVGREHAERLQQWRETLELSDWRPLHEVAAAAGVDESTLQHWCREDLRCPALGDPLKAERRPGIRRDGSFRDGLWFVHRDEISRLQDAFAVEHGQGMTITEFAAAIGVRKRTIHKWIREECSVLGERLTPAFVPSGRGSHPSRLVWIIPTGQAERLLATQREWVPVRAALATLKAKMDQILTSTGDHAVKLASPALPTVPMVARWCRIEWSPLLEEEFRGRKMRRTDGVPSWHVHFESVDALAQHVLHPTLVPVGVIADRTGILSQTLAVWFRDGESPRLNSSIEGACLRPMVSGRGVKKAWHAPLAIIDELRSTMVDAEDVEGRIPIEEFAKRSGVEHGTIRRWCKIGSCRHVDGPFEAVSVRFSDRIRWMISDSHVEEVVQARRAEALKVLPDAVPRGWSEFHTPQRWRAETFAIDGQPCSVKTWQRRRSEFEPEFVHPKSTSRLVSFKLDELARRGFTPPTD